jgi:hypothetical protein
MSTDTSESESSPSFFAYFLVDTRKYDEHNHVIVDRNLLGKQNGIKEEYINIPHEI